MDQKLLEYFQNVELYDEEAEQAPSKSELDTIVAYLLGDLPADEAARLLARRPTQQGPALTRKLRMSMLWFLINDIAIKFPSTQTKIVDLIKAIRKSAHTDSTNSEDNWSTLGTWLNKWGDSINNYEAGYLWPESEDGIEATLWPRVTAYSARLVATQDPIIGNSFFVLRCCPSIVRALDTNQTLQFKQYHPDIVAAAQLFILCPRQLLERCQSEDSVEWLAEDHVKGDILWKGDITKLSVERWKHWKDRWQAIQQSEILGAEIKQLATESLEGMNLAESN